MGSSGLDLSAWTGAGYAKGDSFSGGTTLPSNTVLTKTTPFRFAKGAAFGVAGEVPGNPEAVMPLKRGPDGTLGVRMFGGGGAPVNVKVETNIYSDGTADTNVTSDDKEGFYREFTERMRLVAKQTVMDEVRPGGALHRAGVRA